MNIDRHNYEEFFILYLDNELSPAERKAVELFVQENPDLAEEFSLLQQTRFDADPAFVFEGKEVLMKPVNAQEITPGNYEEWLLLYIDNELNPGQRAAVEAFAATRPAIKEELEVLQKTKLQPETQIAFPFKESLYRKEEKARVISFRWWRIAAAAAVLFAVGTIGFYAINNNKTSTEGNGGVVIATPKSGSDPVTAPVKSETPETGTALAKQDEPVTDPAASEKNISRTVSTPAPANVIAVAPKTQEKVIQAKENEAPVIALENQKNRNNLPEPKYNPNMQEPTTERSFADNNSPSPNVLKENKPQSLVTSGTSSPFQFTGNKQDSEDDIAANQTEKKSRFRGLLRKITRTIEKTTNIKATDDDDRLLVGGLAIRL